MDENSIVLALHSFWPFSIHMTGAIIDVTASILLMDLFEISKEERAGVLSRLVYYHDKFAKFVKKEGHKSDG